MSLRSKSVAPEDHRKSKNCKQEKATSERDHKGGSWSTRCSVEDNIGGKWLIRGKYVTRNQYTQAGVSDPRVELKVRRALTCDAMDFSLLLYVILATH